MINTNESKCLRAKDRIDQIKKFRWFVFMVIVASADMIGFSVFLFSTKAADSFVAITIFLSTTIGLWIILFLEYIRVFKGNFLLGKAWEGRQIKKYLEDDKPETL